MFNKSAYRLFYVFLLAGLIAPSLLHAGWIQKDQDGSVTWISDGKIKVAEPETESSFLILNYKAERVTLVDGARKAYATGTIDEYCRMMQEMMAAFSEMGAAFGGEDDEAPVSVKVVAAGKDTVAGLAADKYKVLVDGELYEEIWLASDAGPMKELGKGHEKFMKCLGESDDPIEKSKAYRELALKGWELRSISHEFGEKEYNTNVIELKQAAIPDSEFNAPGGYKKLKFEEFYNSDME